MMLKRFHPVKPGDIILIVLVALVSLGALFAVPLMLGEASANGKTIVVTMDGQVIHRIPMPETDTLETIDFPIEVSGRDFTATLEVMDGAVRLQRLPQDISPLSIHADMGWIREPYQMIISLPIRLYITIEFEEIPDDTPEIDTLVY